MHNMISAMSERKKLRIHASLKIWKDTTWKIKKKLEI